MNLVYCELFSLLSAVVADPDAQHVDGADGQAGKKRKLNGSSAKTPKSSMQSSLVVAAKQAIRVREYVVRRLRGSGIATAVPHGQSIGHALTAQTYVALLPTLWWLLCQSGGEVDGGPSETLSAILQHATKTGSTSGVKIPATEFIARLLQVRF